MVDKVEQLSPRREKFCQLYTSNDRELFGNGVQSYIEAYSPDTSKPNWYKTACACSSRMLSNVNVIEKINELLVQQGFNDENVEKQHLFLLNPHDDKGIKMRAVDSYYKLKGKNPTETIIIKTEDKDKAKNALKEYLNVNTKNTTGREQGGEESHI